jgi:single-strand DNA-binding protein
MAGNAVTTIEGNLTADPELRFTPTGAAVANFTVASSPRIRDNQTGEWKDGEASFTRCSVWRQQAENLVESLTKGMGVLVHGEFKQRHWKTRDGEPRSTWELQVRAIGPSLRFATAKVTKVKRATATAAADDPWNSAEPATEPAETTAFAA